MLAIPPITKACLPKCLTVLLISRKSKFALRSRRGHDAVSLRSSILQSVHGHAEYTAWCGIPTGRGHDCTRGCYFWVSIKMLRQFQFTTLHFTPFHSTFHSVHFVRGFPRLQLPVRGFPTQHPTHPTVVYIAMFPAYCHLNHEILWTGKS